MTLDDSGYLELRLNLATLILWFGLNLDTWIVSKFVLGSGYLDIQAVKVQELIGNK